MVWSPNESRLVIAVRGFREGIIKGVTNSSNGGNSADLAEAFHKADGR